MTDTDISICSRALVQLGAQPITSFIDKTDTAKICANVYPGIKRSIMSRYGWRHLMVKKALTKDATPPAGEWANSFILPGDALALPHAIFNNTSGTVAEHQYEIFGRRIFTNFDQIVMDYVIERPESEWPAYFVELMVSAMAAAIAFAVTDQQNVADKWDMKTYGTPSDGGVGGVMGEAMTLDAQSSGNIGFKNDAFTNARFGGGY